MGKKQSKEKPKFDEACQTINPKQIKNKPDAVLYREMTIPNACAKHGSVKKQILKYMPSNGEFAWVGEGDECLLHPTKAPSEYKCPSDHLKNKAKGRRGKYKRVAFHADNKICCLNQPETGTVGDLTCNPKLTMSSRVCTPILREFCSKNDRVFNHPTCKKFCNIPAARVWCQDTKKTYCATKNPFTDKQCLLFCKDSDNQEICNQWKKSRCDGKPERLTEGSNCYKWCRENPSFCKANLQIRCNKDQIFTDPACQSFCSDTNKSGVQQNATWCTNSKAEYCNNPKHTGTDECITWCLRNHGMCDQGMQAYCNQEINKDRPECACLVSKARFNPSCVDSKCSSVGYQTSSMYDAAHGGCKIIDCSQKTEMSNFRAAGEIKLLNSYSQKCGIDTNTTVTNTEKTSDIKEYDSDALNPDEDSQTKYSGKSTDVAKDRPNIDINYKQSSKLANDSKVTQTSTKTTPTKPSVFKIFITIGILLFIAAAMFFYKISSEQENETQNRISGVKT